MNVYGTVGMNLTSKMDIGMMNSSSIVMGTMGLLDHFLYDGNDSSYHSNDENERE